MFKKATKQKTRLRLAITGGPGAGKTYTALRFATALARHLTEANGRPAKIAVISTEFGAIEKYLGAAPDGEPFAFDVGELPNFAPTSYTQAIQQAAREGYDVLIVDSLSHAWSGKDGALEQVDKKAGKGSSFTAWKDVTPQHNAMIEAINQSPIHVIATMRSKVDYVLEEYTDTDGRKKSAPRKVGMAPVQRQGMEYEFDLVCDLDDSHLMKVTKSRCPAVDGATILKPGAEFVDPIWAWLNDGDAPPPPVAGSAVPPPPAASADSGNARAIALGEMGLRASVAVVNGDADAATTPSAANDPRNGAPAEPDTIPFDVSDPAAKIDAARIKEIKRLVVAVAMPQPVIDATLRKRGVGSWRSLNVGQADEIISRLRGMELGLAAIPWDAEVAAATNGATAATEPAAKN